MKAAFAIGILAIVILGIAAAVLAPGGLFSSPTGEFSLAVTSCIDSDGGLNYDVAGTVYATFANGSKGTFADYCLTSKKVREFSCSGSKKVLDTDKDCTEKFGSKYVCSKGACTKGSGGGSGGNQSNGTGNQSNGTGNFSNGTGNFTGNQSNGTGNFSNGTGNQSNGSGNFSGNQSNGTGNLTHPLWFGPSANSTQHNQAVLFTVYWTTNRTFASAGYVFSWDASGAMANDSFVSFGTSGSTAWSNVTKLLPNATNQTITWIVYANNSANEWNGTINTLVTT